MPEQLGNAIDTVLALFQGLGLSRETILAETGETGVEPGSKAVIEELSAEPDNEAILVTRIKNQTGDQKAM